MLLRGQYVLLVMHWLLVVHRLLMAHWLLLVVHWLLVRRVDGLLHCSVVVVVVVVMMLRICFFSVYHTTLSYRFT